MNELLYKVLYRPMQTGISCDKKYNKISEVITIEYAYHCRKTYRVDFFLALERFADFTTLALTSI